MISDLIRLIFSIIIILWFGLTYIFKRERITKSEGFIKFAYYLCFLFALVDLITLAFNHFNG